MILTYYLELSGGDLPETKMIYFCVIYSQQSNCFKVMWSMRPIVIRESATSTPINMDI